MDVDIKELHTQFWTTLKQNAEGLTGVQVLEALDEITEEIWNAGIDAAYIRATFVNETNINEAWDYVWMTALAIKLHKMHSRK